MEEPKITFFDWVKVISYLVFLFCLVAMIFSLVFLPVCNIYLYITMYVCGIIACIPYRRKYWKKYIDEMEWEEKHKDGDTTIHFTIKIWFIRKILCPILEPRV